MIKTIENNLQEKFLHEVKTKSKLLEVNLVNGLVIKGKLISYDNFSILLLSNNKDFLFYKHAVAYITVVKK